MSDILSADWKPEEREVIENLAVAHRVSPMVVLRQALRLYQQHDRRLSNGETCTYSGDADRAASFFTTPVIDEQAFANEKVETLWDIAVELHDIAVEGIGQKRSVLWRRVRKARAALAAMEEKP